MLSTGQTPNNMLSTGQTPNMLSTGQTPQNMLGSTPHSMLASGTTPSLSNRAPEASQHGGPPVYAPVASPAPPTPAIQPSATDIIPQLQNIVRYVGQGIESNYLIMLCSTVNMCSKLDLKKIALHARNAEYNPKRFAAVIMRIREPRTTALIFSSGTIAWCVIQYY